MGLFADRLFLLGDFIGIYDGLELDTDPESLKAYKGDKCLTLGDNRVVDGAYSRAGLVQFANHCADNPNAKVLQDGRMVALQPISVGDEIVFDYGLEYWEEESPTKKKESYWDKKSCANSCRRPLALQFLSKPTRELLTRPSAQLRKSK